MSQGLYLSEARIHEIVGILGDTITRYNKAARTADITGASTMATASRGEARAYAVVKRRLLWLVKQPSDSLVEHKEVKEAKQAGFIQGMGAVVQSIQRRSQQ